MGSGGGAGAAVAVGVAAGVAVGVAAGAGLRTAPDEANFDALPGAGFKGTERGWPSWARSSLAAMSLLRSVSSRWSFACRTPALSRQRMNATTDTSLRPLGLPQVTARRTPPNRAAPPKEG